MEPFNDTVPGLLNPAPQQEQHKDQTTSALVGKMTKHSVIIRKGTTFLIVFSILSLYAAMYLIHMESVERHEHSGAYKTAVR